jgi:predicted PurR-regulated permease PerM
MESSTDRPGELRRVRAALTLLAVLAVLAALHFARAMIVPVALALFFALLLYGPVERLRRWKLPRAVGSAVVMLVLLGIVTVLVDATISPAREWLERAPKVLRDVERKIRPLQQVAVRIDEVAQRAERVAEGSGRSDDVAAVVPRKRSVLFSTPAALITAAATFFLTYFFLAWGPALLARLGESENPGERSRALAIAQAVQHETSRYLGTIALINVGLGIATALLTAAFGLPTPLLWGVMAATLNFIPYAGSAVTLGVLTIVALLTQDGLGPAAGVAASYLALATIEGQLVQPLAVGRRLSLSPLVVFVGLWFWGWLWGVAGMLLATPMLIAMKAASCQVPGLDRIAEILSPQRITLASKAENWRERRVQGRRAAASQGGDGTGVTQAGAVPRPGPGSIVPGIAGGSR